MAFDDHLTVSTPEGLDLEIVLAGVGSRFGAAALDALIQLVALIALLVVRSTVSSGGGGGFLAAIYIVAVFLIVFGYDVAFETLNSGRTPGKMAAGLRVVRAGGRPVGFLTSAVRNLLRIVDFLPTAYAAGLVSIVATRDNQRIGDLAAGTYVVRERVSRPTSTLTFSPAAYAPDAPFLSWDVSAVSPEEVATVRRFLERRSQLTSDARARIGWEMCERLRPKVAGLPTNWHPETLLEGIVAAKAARG